MAGAARGRPNRPRPISHTPCIAVHVPLNRPARLGIRADIPLWGPDVATSCGRGALTTSPPAPGQPRPEEVHVLHIRSRSPISSPRLAIFTAPPSRRKAAPSTIWASTASTSSISPSPSTRRSGSSCRSRKWTQEVNDARRPPSSISFSGISAPASTSWSPSRGPQAVAGAAWRAGGECGSNICS